MDTYVFQIKLIFSFLLLLGTNYLGNDTIISTNGFNYLFLVSPDNKFLIYGKTINKEFGEIQNGQLFIYSFSENKVNLLAKDTFNLNRISFVWGSNNSLYYSNGKYISQINSTGNKRGEIIYKTEANEVIENLFISNDYLKLGIWVKVHSKKGAQKKFSCLDLSTKTEFNIYSLGDRSVNEVIKSNALINKNEAFLIDMYGDLVHINLKTKKKSKIDSNVNSEILSLNQNKLYYIKGGYFLVYDSLHNKSFKLLEDLSANNYSLYLESSNRWVLGMDNKLFYYQNDTKTAEFKYNYKEDEKIIYISKSFAIITKYLNDFDNQLIVRKIK